MQTSRRRHLFSLVESFGVHILFYFFLRIYLRFRTGCVCACFCIGFLRVVPWTMRLWVAFCALGRYLSISVRVLLCLHLHLFCFSVLVSQGVDGGRLAINLSVVELVLQICIRIIEFRFQV